ncbi:MAG TPA: beta-propeller fold lactonase family protein, partial [Gallionella sp.]
IDPVAGLYVYVANAGIGAVSGYALDPATCALTTMDTDAVTGGTQATIAAGVTPLSVSIDPSSQYVYVANFTDNTVSTYSIGASGALTPVGTATATGAGPGSVTTVGQ